jgi:hypothetical protein
MPLPPQLATELAHGAAYSFKDWPNLAVPTFGAGVYTIWHKDGRFIYVGMSGRGITAETTRRNTPLAGGAVAINSAFTWPTVLFCLRYRKTTLQLLLQAVITWMLSCGDTSTTTSAIALF